MVDGVLLFKNVFVKRKAYERMVGQSGLWSKNGCQVWHNGQMIGQSGLWSKAGCELWHIGQLDGFRESKAGCEVYHPDRWLARMVYGLRMVAKYGIRTDGWPEWDMI
jgi:hypothetical protein